MEDCSLGFHILSYDLFFLGWCYMRRFSNVESNFKDANFSGSTYFIFVICAVILIVPLSTPLIVESFSHCSNPVKGFQTFIVTLDDLCWPLNGPKENKTRQIGGIKAVQGQCHSNLCWWQVYQTYSERGIDLLSVRLTIGAHIQHIGISLFFKSDSR